MLPWMSISGDCRTASTPLHYVTPDSKWQADKGGRSGFDAICGERVLPLWGAYEEAVEVRPRCEECARFERDQGQ